MVGPAVGQLGAGTVTFSDGDVTLVGTEDMDADAFEVIGLNAAREKYPWLDGSGESSEQVVIVIDGRRLDGISDTITAGHHQSAHRHLEHVRSGLPSRTCDPACYACSGSIDRPAEWDPSAVALHAPGVH